MYLLHVQYTSNVYQMHNDCIKLICRAKQKLLRFGITLLKKKIYTPQCELETIFYFCDVILIEIEIVYSVQSFDSLFNDVICINVPF